MITVASALNFAVLLTLRKNICHTWKHRELLQTGHAVCPLLLLWLQMCILGHTVDSLQPSFAQRHWSHEQHMLWQGVLSQGFTHNASCAQGGVSVQTVVDLSPKPDLQLDSASTFGSCRVPTGFSHLVESFFLLVLWGIWVPGEWGRCLPVCLQVWCCCNEAVGVTWGHYWVT